MNRILTSEQVSWGHPDKICDQIGDAIVSWCLKENENARCAIEVMAKNRTVYISGEISGVDYVPFGHLANMVTERIGIPDFETIDYSNITRQSPDIARGVDNGGAGDQGIMIGYSTNETPQLLPKPFAIATRVLEILREDDKGIFLPDAKAQVSYDYTSDTIDTFLISSQHREKATAAAIRENLLAVMKQTAEEFKCRNTFTALVNPTGRFVIGGTEADTGVLGRKIVCDAYGPLVPVGGGAFSGKCPSKVDRSAAYMVRFVANEVVKSGYADTCKIQVSYGIGIAQPIALAVWCNGKYSDYLTTVLLGSYDWTPDGIIKRFDLKHFDYNKVSYGGHFGKPDLPWELTK